MFTAGSLAFEGQGSKLFQNVSAMVRFQASIVHPVSRGQIPMARDKPPAWGVALRIAVLMLPVLSACSPSLNWRLSRLDSHGAVALFPCKPERRERAIRLGGQLSKVEMQSCEAGGGVFAMMSSDVGDPARVPDALDAWKQAAAANTAAPARTSGEAKVKGMTTGPGAARLRFEGRTPDGDAVVEEAIFFYQGARIFQASVVARTWDQGAADTFFEGVAFP